MSPNALTVVDSTKSTAIAPTAIAPTLASPELSLDEMMKLGQMLSTTGFLPAHIKTGAQAVAIMLTGRELGIPVMRALRSFAMVQGKVTEGADSQLARFKSSGGRAEWVTLTDTVATIKLRHPNGDTHEESFTMQDATAAGMAAGPMYKKYPKAMLRSRAITAGLKSLGWDGAVGVYDPGELPAPSTSERREPPTLGSPKSQSESPRLVAVAAEGDDVSLERPATVDADGVDLVDSEVSDALKTALGYTVKGEALGDLSTDRLSALSSWATAKGRSSLVDMCNLVLADRTEHELVYGTDEVSA